MANTQTTSRPADWKNYDDFAAGIATNRLPSTEALAGRTLRLVFADHTLVLRPRAGHELLWQEETGDTGASPRPAVAEGRGWYDAVEAAPGTFFIDLTQAGRPDQALTVVLNTRTLRVLAVRCRIQSPEEAGTNPRVAQTFHAGTLAEDGRAPGGPVPHETRELIGLRTWQDYSPAHLYEHTYLNSQRYAWQCLLGVQRGQGDVDLASYWKFDEQQYVFTFREFLIPVASVFFFDFAAGRSTGKFLGLTGAGAIDNQPAGAFMRKASLTTYPTGHEPA